MIRRPGHFHRALCFVLGVALVAGAGAQETQTPATQSHKPIVQTSLSQSQVVPGQSVTFQVTVLAPTWLTKPVEFPVFDRPNLSVTLPERSTVSTSQTIDGTTWSGVVREYRLVPLVPGIFRLPPSNLSVHYRNPDGTDDITREIPLTAESLTVKAPPGAEKLKPYIAARELTLQQQIEGDPESLRPGDSFSRTVTAQIEGATVMFLPQLLTTDAPQGVAAYADTSKSSEDDDGNGGTRVEKVTYVAETPARGQLPAIRLQWYDLDDGTIQTSTLNAVAVRVKGVPALGRISPLQWLSILALLGALAWTGSRTLLPMITRARARRAEQRRFRGEETLEKLRSATRRRDYAGAMAAAIELESISDYRHSDIPDALLALGRARYGDPAATESYDSLWQRLDQAISSYTQTAHSHLRPPEIPPLNPTATH